MNIDLELEETREIFDKALRDYIDKYEFVNEKIKNSVEYSLFTGGKRLRPVVSIKTYEMYSKDISKVLAFSMAIEMIHTYSLIHDDLPSMDNDDYRRGKLTNHKVFGEDMAILAGDGLLNLAFEVLLGDDLANEACHNHLRAAGEIARYSGLKGMIGGQVLDLNMDSKTLTEGDVLNMYRLKTSGLFTGAVVAGAIVAGADNRDIELLRSFALSLGMAYQIQDDLLDREEDKEIGKITYLSLFTKEEAKKKVDQLSEEAISKLRNLKDLDTSFLEALVYKLVNRRV